MEKSMNMSNFWEFSKVDPQASYSVRHSRGEPITKKHDYIYIYILDLPSREGLGKLQFLKFFPALIK